MTDNVDETTPLPQTEQSQSSQDAGLFTNLSEIIIRQQVDWREMSRGTEEPNQYKIFRKGEEDGEALFRVIEKEAACMQQTCANNRTFDLRVVDKFNREVVRIVRPQLSCGWGFLCHLTDCFDKIQVYVRNYKSMSFEWQLFGEVCSYWCPLFPLLKIYDADGSKAYSITGPIANCGLASFPLTGQRGQEVGEIRKEWSGLCREYTTEYDLFSLKFPPQADDKMRAVLLGALFLIDFKYFERTCCINC